MKMKYEIGKKYIVSDCDRLEDEDYCNDEDNQRILVAYLPNTIYPFVCVNKWDEGKYEKGKKYDTVNWRYAKLIPEKKYKAYEKPNLEWLEKEVKGLYSGKIFKIKYVGKDSIMFDGDCVSFQNLYKLYTWVENDSVCGEEI